jgi:putative endonuclease
VPIGRKGEVEAAKFLERHGFRILERNVRSRLGELDLVVQDGTSLVFVEVKTRRAGPGDPPQAAVDGAKRQRLTWLALEYLRQRRGPAMRCRFDVVAVTLGEGGRPSRVVHVRDAFEVDANAG